MTDTNSNAQADQNSTTPVAEAKVEPKVETVTPVSVTEAKTEEKKTV